MKSIRMVLLAGLVSLACFAAPAQAQLIVFGNGNLADTASPGGNTFNVNSRWATPFTPNSSSLAQRTLGGAHVLVGGQTEDTTFRIQIYENPTVFDAPTNLVTQSSNFTVSANAGVAWQYLSFTAPVSLDDSETYYYLAIEKISGGSGFKWSTPTNNRTYSPLGSGSSYATPGEVGYIYGYDDGTWNLSGSDTDNLPFGYQLQAVPEPGSMILTGLAMAGGGVAGFFRRRKNKTTGEPTDAAQIV